MAVLSGFPILLTRARNLRDGHSLPIPGPAVRRYLSLPLTRSSRCAVSRLTSARGRTLLVLLNPSLTHPACYWTIITLIFWVALTASTPMGYKILNLDSITRHLRFAVLESTVLCVSLFGNVLTWMAFGLGRDAYLSVQNGGGSPKSGHAMETSAVAGMIGLISLFTAVWGLHLRLGQAQARWKDEAVMVRRRSMALMAHASQTGDTQGLEGRLSQLGMNEKFGGRWSQGSQGNGMVPAPGYSNGLGVNDGQPGRRASTAKFGYAGDDMLEENLNIAKRNSRDHQDMSLRRSS